MTRRIIARTNIIYLSLSFLVAVVPILHLQLGTNMNPDDIEEGDDVYFECQVKANPGAYKVVWKHNVSTVLPVMGGILAFVFLYTCVNTPS